MKLKKLENIIDNCAHVRIWSDEETDEPVFSGYFMDIPWWVMDCPLDIGGDAEPIEFTTDVNEYNNTIPIVIIYIKV